MIMNTTGSIAPWPSCQGSSCVLITLCSFWLLASVLYRDTLATGHSTCITPLLFLHASFSPIPVKYSSGSSAKPMLGSTSIAKRLSKPFTFVGTWNGHLVVKHNLGGQNLSKIDMAALLIYLGELLAKGIGDIVSWICRDYENCFTDLKIWSVMQTG